MEKYQARWYRPKQLFPGQAKLAWLIPFNVLSHLCWKLDEYSITQLLPYIQDEFRISALDAQWYSTAYYLASAGFAIPLGKVGERFGQPIVIIVCLAFYALADLLTFFSRAYWQVIILRVFAGLFISGMVCNKNALLTKFPSQQDSGKSISISLIINNLVIVFIPFICGTTIDKLGWRWNMVFASCSACVCIVALLFFYNNPFNMKLRFDVLGSLMLMLSVASFCAIFVLLARELFVVGGVMVPICVLCVVLLVFVEKRAKDPVLPPYLMRNPISDLFIGYTLNYVNEGGILFIYPQAMSLLGYSATVVGTVTAISGAVLLGMSFLIPVLQEKIVNSVLVVAFSAFAVVVTAVYIAFYSNFYCNSVTFAAYNATFMSVMVVLYKTLLMSVPQKFASRVSGFPTTGRTVGNSISLCVFSSVAAVAQSLLSGKPNKEVISFQICGGFVVCFSVAQALLMVLRVGNNESERGQLCFSAKRVHDVKLPQEMMEGDARRRGNDAAIETELMYEQVVYYR